MIRVNGFFYRVNLSYQQIKGYLGRELQDMERVVYYTTGRYLTDTMSNLSFDAAKTVASKSAETIAIKSQFYSPEENFEFLNFYFSALTSEEFRLRQAYRKHNTYVQSKVPAEDLLVWKVKDGWEPLCKFLNCPIPDGPIPHDNRTGDTKFIEGPVRKLKRQFCFQIESGNRLKNMHGNQSS